MHHFWSNLLFAFWIFLPAGVANMSPVLANHIPGLRRWTTPLDFGKSYRGKRILGDNKRWRGLVVGTVAAAITGVIEFAIFSRFLISFETLVIVIIGASLMGLGALVGDAVESLLKRRAGIKPGHSWFPFDQVDYIIGGLLFSYPILVWPLRLAITIFVVYFGLHILVSYLAYLIGLKDKPI